MSCDCTGLSTSATLSPILHRPVTGSFNTGDCAMESVCWDWLISFSLLIQWWLQFKINDLSNDWRDWAIVVVGSKYQWFISSIAKLANLNSVGDLVNEPGRNTSSVRTSCAFGWYVTPRRCSGNLRSEWRRDDNNCEYRYDTRETTRGD